MIGDMGDRGWHGPVSYFDDKVKRESLNESIKREFSHLIKKKKAIFPILNKKEAKKCQRA